jgi:hypothetical protein
MRGLFFVAVMLVSSVVRAEEGGTSPRVNAPKSAAAKAVRKAAKAPVATATAPAASAGAPAPAAKRPPVKAVSLDAAAVTGERQRPRAAYVLTPNVKAVRDAANTITDDHLESARKP